MRFMYFSSPTRQISHPAGHGFAKTRQSGVTHGLSANLLTHSGTRDDLVKDQDDAKLAQPVPRNHFKLFLWCRIQALR